MLTKGKQFLFIIRLPPSYSYISSNPALAVIDRNCVTFNQIMMATIEGSDDFWPCLISFGVSSSVQKITVLGKSSRITYEM